MVNQKNLRVIFTQEAEVIFDNILRNIGLQETDQELDEYISSNQESRAMIIKDAVEDLAKKNIYEKEFVDWLENIMQVPRESAKKIVSDIKVKLLPLLLVYPEERFNNPAFQEEVSKKVFGVDGQLPASPYSVKKTEVSNVEENEKILKQNKEKAKLQNINQGDSFTTEPDKYREPVE